MAVGQNKPELHYLGLRRYYVTLLHIFEHCASLKFRF